MRGEEEWEELDLGQYVEVRAEQREESRPKKKAIECEVIQK